MSAEEGGGAAIAAEAVTAEAPAAAVSEAEGAAPGSEAAMDTPAAPESDAAAAADGATPADAAAAPEAVPTEEASAGEKRLREDENDADGESAAEPKRLRADTDEAVQADPAAEGAQGDAAAAGVSAVAAAVDGVVASEAASAESAAPAVEAVAARPTDADADADAPPAQAEGAEPPVSDAMEVETPQVADATDEAAASAPTSDAAAPAAADDPATDANDNASDSTPAPPAPAPAPPPASGDANGAASSELPDPAPAPPAGTTENSDEPRTRLTNQLQWLASKLVKSLISHQMSWPFRVPVDPVYLKLPTYFDVIKRPMDLSTVRSKLKERKYWAAQEAIDDLRLIWANCRTFNRPGDDVCKMADMLEKHMDQKLTQMPTPETEIFPSAKRGKRAQSAGVEGNPLATPPPSGGTVPGRRSSTRPVRPPVKDLIEESFMSLPNASTKKSGKKTTARMKFCHTLIRELMHKRHADYSWPFKEPVDVEKLNLTDYHTVITKPMDLGTVRKKLDAGVYAEAEDFLEDIELIFSNCYAYGSALDLDGTTAAPPPRSFNLTIASLYLRYNPKDHDITKLAKQLHDVYVAKKAGMPPKDEIEEQVIAAENAARNAPPPPAVKASKGPKAPAKAKAAAKARAAPTAAPTVPTPIIAEVAPPAVMPVIPTPVVPTPIVPAAPMDVEKPAKVEKPDKPDKPDKKSKKKEPKKQEVESESESESDESSSESSDDSMDADATQLLYFKAMLAKMESKMFKKKKKKKKGKSTKTPKAAKSKTNAGKKKTKPKSAPRKPRAPAKKKEKGAAAAQLKKKAPRKAASSDEASSDSSDDNVEEVMTWDEKRELSQDVNDLSEEHLHQVVAIIKKREKGLSASSEEIEIDFAQLQNSTLRALKDFVASTKVPKKKKPKKGAMTAEEKEADIQRRLANVNSQLGDSSSLQPWAEEESSRAPASEGQGSRSTERDADYVVPPQPVPPKKTSSAPLSRPSKRQSEHTTSLITSSTEVQSSNEVVLFDAAQRIDSGGGTASASVELLQATSTLASVEADDIQVENASAWLSFGADASLGGAAGEPASENDASDFSKFQRLNQEKMVRDQVDAEEAQRLEKERIEAEAKKREVAEQQRLERERMLADKEMQQAAEEAQKQADAMAERERLREEARREREAMTGHMDLHQQSNMMAAFGNEDDGDDDLDNLLE